MWGSLEGPNTSWINHVTRTSQRLWTKYLRPESVGLQAVQQKQSQTEEKPLPTQSIKLQSKTLSVQTAGQSSPVGLGATLQLCFTNTWQDLCRSNDHCSHLDPSPCNGLDCSQRSHSRSCLIKGASPNESGTEQGHTGMYRNSYCEILQSDRGCCHNNKSGNKWGTWSKNHTSIISYIISE